MSRPGDSATPLSRLCLAGYFFMGSVAVLFPTLLPVIVGKFGLSLAAVGVIFPANAVGSLIGGLAAGIGSDRFGRRPFLAGGAFLLTLGLVITARAGNWPLFVFGFLVIGVAQGAVSIGINALMLDIRSQRRGKALNSLHGVYSLGAMLSPFLIEGAFRAVGWRGVFTGVASVWLLVALVSVRLRYPAVAVAAAKTRLPALAVLTQGVFVLLIAIAFIYNGVAWSLLGWIKVYVQQSGVKSGLVSTGMISLFYAALAAGRFACAAFSERLGYGNTLLVCAVGSALAYPLVLFDHRPLWVAAGMLLSGLFLSGLYPTALAYGTRRSPSLAGTITATMSIAMTMGSMFPPWWTGIAAGRWNLAVAFEGNYLLVVPLLGIAFLLRRQERRAGMDEAALSTFP